VQLRKISINTYRSVILQYLQRHEYNVYDRTYWTCVQPDYFYILAGKCQMMGKYHWKLFRQVLREMYYRYPNAGDSRAVIGDMNAYPDCSGHPVGSHSTGYSVDVCYFTTTKNNFTQSGYTPIGEKTTPLWDEEDELINFDTERNRKFVLLIRQAFPHVRVLVDKRLKAVFASDLDWVWGGKPRKWNHHLHMHIELGKIEQ